MRTQKIYRVFESRAKMNDLIIPSSFRAFFIVATN